MTRSFQLFFNTLLHPTKKLDGEDRISYVEVLGISWGLHMVYAFYSVFALYLGILSYDYLSTSENFSHMLFQSFNLTFQKISLMGTLFEVIFYPFIFQFAFKFWAFVVKFYAQMYDYAGKDESKQDDDIDELLTTSFTTNIFLIIPIFGNLISIVAQAYYIFIGLRKKFSFTGAQAFLILITPLFVLFLLSILIASYFVFLFSIL